MAIEGIAPAKINLCLHLTGLRDDGYHLLESLVVFADFGDVLRVEPAEDLSLTVTGPFAEGVPSDGRNLVLRAAEALRAARGVPSGAAITLQKNLPHGAGIGGGSSDAACALRLLAELWGVAGFGSAEALALGADVPVCLCAPDPVMMRGIGEDLSLAPPLPKGWLVLVNPGVQVATAKAFAVHDALYATSPLGVEPMDWADGEEFETWLLGQRNDLTKVVCERELAPVVHEVLDALWASGGCKVAEMSGSGSTCWGWFESEDAARGAAEALGHAHPNWWLRVTSLG